MSRDDAMLLVASILLSLVLLPWAVMRGISAGLSGAWSENLAVIRCSRCRARTRLVCAAMLPVSLVVSPIMSAALTYKAMVARMYRGY